MHVCVCAYVSKMAVCVWNSHCYILSPPSPLPALSYHQKYLLRQQRDILRELNLSEAELITSYAACRLNGYCGGYGSLTAYDKESPSFKLSSSAQERVRKIVARGSMHWAHSKLWDSNLLMYLNYAVKNICVLKKVVYL